jgi:mannose-6-phosphate isomerase
MSAAPDSVVPLHGRSPESPSSRSESAAGSPAGEQDPLPRVIPKPWGHELWFAHTDRYAGKLLHVKAGHRLSLQYHERKDETSYLLSGRLLLSQGPEDAQLTERELAPGAVWRNEPRLIHTIEALTDSTVVEVSTPELEDVVRLADRYGRATRMRPASWELPPGGSLSRSGR